MTFKYLQHQIQVLSSTCLIFKYGTFKALNSGKNDSSTVTCNDESFRRSLKTFLFAKY